MAQLSGSDWKTEKIAEIDVAQHVLEIFQLLGDPIELAAIVADLGAGGPVKLLGQGAKFEAEIA